MRAPLLRLLLVALLAAGGRASDAESRLLEDLMTGYDRRARAVANVTDVVQVTTQITLLQVELDLARHEAVLSLWVNLQWNDPRLRWRRQDYDDISDVRLMSSDIWMPDIMPYNAMPRPTLDWIAQTPTVLSSDGGLLNVGPASVRVRCRRDYLFGDDFRCSLKLGSWSYNGFQVDLVDPSVDLSSYVIADHMWELRNASTRRNVVTYACCPEPYVDVTLEINMRRPGALSQWPNLPVAVAMIACAAGFLVPVDSAQKLTLPTLAVLAAGSAAVAEFGLVGTAQFRAHFLRAYHAYTYVALGCLVWAVLMTVLGRPRTARLPDGLRRLLRSCLAVACCLASAADDGDKPKLLCYEWTALAELLDRLAGTLFVVLLIVGSAVASLHG